MLKWILGLDTAQVKKGAKETEQTIGQLAENAKGKLSGIAGALGVGVSAAGTVAYVRDLANKMDDIGDMAERLNTTTAAVQTLGYAFERGGSSVEEMEMSLNRARKMLDDATTGSDEARTAFGMIGLSWKNLQGLSPEQLFVQIARAIQALPPEVDKGAKAMDFFGRSGARVLPIIADLENLRSELTNTNRLITDEAITAASNYNDTMLNLEKTLQSITGNSGIIDWLSEVADRMDQTLSLRAKMDKFKDQGGSGVYANKTYGTVTSIADSLWGMTPIGMADKIFNDQTASERMEGFFSKKKPVLEMDYTDDEQKKLQERQEKIKKLRDFEKMNQGLVDRGAITRQQADENILSYKTANKVASPKEEKAAADAERTRIRTEAANKTAIDAEKKKAETIAKNTEDLDAQAKLLEVKGSLSENEEEIRQNILKTEREIGRAMTDQEKSARRTAIARIQAAEAAQKAHEAEKKFVEAFTKQSQSVKFSLMEKLGYGEKASIEKAIADLQPANAEQKAKAEQLGKAQYEASQLGQNRPEFQTQDLTNDLARIGGWNSSVVAADTESISKYILEENKKMTEILGRIEQQQRDNGGGLIP